MLRLFISALCGFCLVGCSSTPVLDDSRFSRAVTVNQAVELFDEHKYKELLWGGRVVGVENLPDGTQLEVVGYPLRSNQIPNTGKAGAGRFIVFTTEFLEPVDFHEGRVVTVGGRLDRIETGKTGSVEYIYPVLVAERIQLWPVHLVNRSPRFHFGFGFTFSN